jgi:uncharacterized protein
MSENSSVPSGSVWDEMKAGAAHLGASLTSFGTPTVRLGVTGLSRAGKTVFITALVQALTRKARLPGFRAMGEGRIAQVALSEHPDGALPRFAYEDHIATLTAPERAWPSSTRQISALVLDIEYASRKRYLGGLFGPAGLIGSGPSRLALDIIDYPGEWLLDLPLLSKSFSDFSAETLAKAGEGRRRKPFEAYLALLASVDARAPLDEGVAKQLAVSFTEGLRACRAEGRELSALPPGRFLMPGDLEGAPALTFAPLPTGDYPEGSLGHRFERRYEAYKSKVVRPFFTDHFARIDRQVVLVDVLGALNGGAEAIADLETALTDVLAAFRLGQNSLLSSLFAPRVSKLLFCATKADHLHHTSHDRLEAILKLLVRRAQARAEAVAVPTDSLALAAIRATREVTAREGGEALPCIAGVPLAGEQVEGNDLKTTSFDGRAEAVIFPGDLPATPEAVFTGKVDVRFPRFRPPMPLPEGGFAQIRLDRALEFLLGDVLA